MCNHHHHHHHHHINLESNLNLWIRNQTTLMPRKQDHICWTCWKRNVRIHTWQTIFTCCLCHTVLSAQSNKAVISWHTDTHQVPIKICKAYVRVAAHICMHDFISGRIHYVHTSTVLATMNFVLSSLELSWSEKRAVCTCGRSRGYACLLDSVHHLILQKECNIAELQLLYRIQYKYLVSITEP
jgi:hypothetical protein